GTEGVLCSNRDKSEDRRIERVDLYLKPLNTFVLSFVPFVVETDLTTKYHKGFHKGHQEILFIISKSKLNNDDTI
ncbi:MAG TPA: hypothetical protein VLR52_04345, partial [Bacteroidales bacterium]|nr:hypothetical protein [Bacteroidales bacterium]